MNQFFSGSKLHCSKAASLILMLLLCLDLPGQIQPLSRNDQAQIEISSSLYETAIQAGKWKEASRHLNDIAFLYWEHNDYKNAIKFYEQSVALNDSLDNENGLAMLHNNLGMLYSDIREYETALSYFEKTLAARRAFKNKEGIIAAIKNISVAQNNLGRFNRSIQLLQEALVIARELNDPDQISSCYLMLSETYEKAGDVTNTRHYYELYQSFHTMKQDRDMRRLQQIADEEALKREIAEIEERKRTAELQMIQSQLEEAVQELDAFDDDLVALTDSLDKTQLQIIYLESERERERLENERKLQKAKTTRNYLIWGTLALLLISFFIYRNYRQEQKSKKALAIKNEQIEKQNDELEELNKIIAKHNERMQTELNVGREIQMSMIPSDFPKMPGVDLYAALEPAREVGGDLYDFFKIDEDHLIVGIGDVSDKGVPAALFMAVTKTLVKTNANYSSLPSKILSEVNKELCVDNDSSMFVTYFLCLLNTKTGQLSYCNAGHNPPLYITSKGDLSKLEQLHGPVLGAVEDFSYKQDIVLMEKGDQLILFTDGITEAFNDGKDQYSDERLDKLFQSNGSHNAQESVEAVIADVSQFRGNAEQSDDITILSLIYTGVESAKSSTRPS